LEKRLPIFTYKKTQRRQSESNLIADEYKVATLKRDSCLSLEPSEKTETDEDNPYKPPHTHNRFKKFLKTSIENLFGMADPSDPLAALKNRRRVRSTSPYPNKSIEQQAPQNQLYDIDSIKSSEESTNSVPSIAGSVIASSGISNVLFTPNNILRKTDDPNKSKFFFPSMEPLQSQESVSAPNTHNISIQKPKPNSAKPGTEILNLISMWIKNAPNDFLGQFGHVGFIVEKKFKNWCFCRQ
jgi:hypothetical protein